jgi:hypothetical protein
MKNIMHWCKTTGHRLICTIPLCLHRHAVKIIIVFHIISSHTPIGLKLAEKP